MNYFVINNLLANEQYCFVSDKSCFSFTGGYGFHNSISIEDGKDVNILFLDFAKAFDSVSHLFLIW
jgi:hypothetical protein